MRKTKDPGSCFRSSPEYHRIHTLIGEARIELEEIDDNGKILAEKKDAWGSCDAGQSPGEDALPEE